MTDTTEQKAVVPTQEMSPVATPKTTSAPVPAPTAERARLRNTMRDKAPLRKKNTRRSSRENRPRSEFDHKILTIRRVARVAAGGRRFSFSVALVLGDRRGSVGVGVGKGADTALAIDKAMRDAKKHLFRVRRTESGSIPHTLTAKYSSARVMMLPSPGRGMVAGSAVRSVLELAGIKDITAKILSPSKNALNVARATVAALASIRGTTAVVVSVPVVEPVATEVPAVPIAVVDVDEIVESK